MMDPAQEEPRVLYRFLSSEKETEAEMENLAKAVAYSYKKERSAERLRGNSMGRCFGEVSREWRDMRHVPIPTS